MIKKLDDGKYRLYSHEGKNLGTFDTYEEAAKHEGEVEWFKEHKNESFSKEKVHEVAEKLGIKFDEFSIDDLIEGMNIELEHKDVTGGDPIETAKIALAHLKERSDYYKKLKEYVEKTNAKDFPKFFYAKHMEAGLCGYEKETVLIDVETLKKMSPSFAGKPVYVGHQKVDLDKIDEADGYVIDCNYNEVDGCLWSKILIKTDKAISAINNGWAVSNAYVPTEFSSGGQYHNLDFDRKIVNAIFTHLAIVPDPRYEQSKILTIEEFKKYCEDKRGQLEELKNSKTSMGVKKMFKFFKVEKKEVSSLEEDTMVELQNGKSVSIKEMIETVEKQNAKKNEADEEEKEVMLNAETEVEVGGKKITLGELMNKYNEIEKKNEADEEAKKKEEAEEKENEEDKEKEEEEKKNQKHFDELKNAKDTYTKVKMVDTEMDQLSRGKARYGSEN